jgi:hypothetical protein
MSTAPTPSAALVLVSATLPAPVGLTPIPANQFMLSSSPVGITEAIGSYYQPPFGGGSASLAIPPTVTCEVWGVSSLVAPPLTVVRALSLTVDLHPSLLGSSWDVSGGAAFPDQFMIPPIKSRSDYLQTQDLILFWLCYPSFSTDCSDANLITDTANSHASQYWKDSFRWQNKMTLSGYQLVLDSSLHSFPFSWTL